MNKLSVFFVALLLSNMPLLAVKQFNFYDFSSPISFRNQSSETPKGWYGGDKTYTPIRRKMLRRHQLFGLITWGLWLETNLEGEKLLKRFKPHTDGAAAVLYASNPSQNLPLALALKFDNPAVMALSPDPNFLAKNLPLYYYIRNHSEWEAEGASTHKTLAAATTGMYILTASLAMLSPSKFNTTASKGVDSIFLHKGLAFVHLAAMIALSQLGPKIEHDGPAVAYKMQNAGWAGFTALTLAVGVIYF